MNTKKMPMTIKAALVGGAFVIIAALLTILFGKSAQMSQKADVRGSNNSQVVQAGRDINVIGSGTVSDAARANFIRLFQKTLSYLNYSYFVLERLPFQRNTSETASPYSAPYNLRRFRLKNKNSYYVFRPLSPENSKSVNEATYFLIEDIQVNKSELYRYFDSPKEVDMMFSLIEMCEDAMSRFLKLWESTLEADAEKIPEWDLHKRDKQDEQLAEYREIQSKQITQLCKDIEALVGLVRSKYGYPLTFTLNKDASTLEIQIAKVYPR